jgi:hypothetical protein
VNKKFNCKQNDNIIEVVYKNDIENGEIEELLISNCLEKEKIVIGFEDLIDCLKENNIKIKSNNILNPCITTKDILKDRLSELKQKEESSRKIKIAGHDYIIEHNELECSIENNSNAIIDYYNKKIFTNFKDYSSQYKRQTICHEILHAFTEETNVNKFLKSHGMNKEEVPSFLENVFYNFLKDNTNFFERLNLE